MHLRPVRRPWLLMAFMLTILAVETAFTPAMAKERLPRFLQFTVQDQDGNFFPIGEVEFCTPEGQCHYADIEKDFPGHFIIASDLLEPGTAYTVRIYDLNVAVHFEMANWVFQPQDFDPVYDPIVQVDKFLIYPRFHGNEQGGFTFRIDSTLNPDWALKKGLHRPVHVDSLPPFPRLIAGFQIPFMLGGNFTTNQEAIGGVDDVRPGIGLSACFRFSYPHQVPPKKKWVFFQEFTLAYQQNRYETWEIITPGRRSDVTFHRVKFTYGVGKMSQSFASHWSVGATLALGGIYDGQKIVKYTDRTYRRNGLGLKASWIQRMFQVGRVDVGFNAQVELMYYFADSGPNDFWYGMAPSASLGLVVF